MKRVIILLLLLGAPLVNGQNSTPAPSGQELQENLNILKGQVDDLKEWRAAQDKRLRDLQSKLDELTAQLNKPSDKYATAEDVKTLRAAIEALDKKQKADNEAVVKTLQEIAKASKAVTPPAPHPNPRTNTVVEPAPVPGPDGPGFTYTARANDTLAKISRNFFEDQHIKATSKQINAMVAEILKANAFLKGEAKNLKEGDKLFIPAPKGVDATGNK